MRTLPIKVIVLVAFLMLVTESYSAGLETDSTQTDTSQHEQMVAAVKSPRRAMIYSLICPGLGQFYNHDYFKSVLFLGGELGLLANSIYLNQQYHQSHDPDEKEFYINNRNLSTWWLIGVILYSTMDAYVNAHMDDFDESPDLDVQMNVKDGDRKVFLTLTYCF